MPHGGSLTIATDCRGGTEDPDYPGIDAGTYVRLSVIDSGSGLEDQASHIFEPFFTTKPPGKGTGLGFPRYTPSSSNVAGISPCAACAAGTTFEILLPAPPATVH